jgi:predicted nucleic acid-binding protein
MSGIRIVCDTNPLIYLLDGDNDVAAFLNGKQIYISVINELELFGKQHLSKADKISIEALVDTGITTYFLGINPPADAWCCMPA